MKYLPKKIIREEIDKVNPKFDFRVELSSNSFSFSAYKCYIITIKYKVFKNNYCSVIPITQELINRLTRSKFRKIFNLELKRINSEFNNWRGRRTVKKRTIRMDKEWARNVN